MTKTVLIYALAICAVTSIALLFLWGAQIPLTEADLVPSGL